MDTPGAPTPPTDVTAAPGAPAPEPVPADVSGTELGRLVGDWLTLPDVSDRLGIGILAVRQLVRDRTLIACRLVEGAPLRVPAGFVPEDVVVKGLPGTITLLGDAGYSDDEAVTWMFTPDDTLPGTPAQALGENRGTEVRRRAQALAF